MEKIVNEDPYPNMETFIYNGNKAYEFISENKSSGKLIIVFEGSGWNSALGIYAENRWQSTRTGAQLIRELNNDYTILMPEKWNRVPGIDYVDNLDARYMYTKENLIECYVSTINAYLAQKDYSSIILVGTSEGAALLPLIYLSMENKDLVKCMVSISAGGLSQYECYLINIKKENVPDFAGDFYSQAIKMHENLEQYYESIETIPMGGLTYRQIVSFVDLRPYDYYKNIDIPILFVHGKEDWAIAVESTMYVQNNLPGKPFEYIYYENMGHKPMDGSETDNFRNDIAKWIKKN
jgi:esterase/lipase